MKKIRCLAAFLLLCLLLQPVFSCFAAEAASEADAASELPILWRRSMQALPRQSRQRLTHRAVLTIFSFPQASSCRRS